MRKILDTTVNPSTTAAICSGMPALWWSSAHLKRTDDRTGITLLNDELLKVAEQIKQRENWKFQKCRNYLYKLVVL
ncbi:MAG: hypothetical protein AB2724_04835, partial [Candidatus Thiodiazotropha sp.]